MDEARADLVLQYVLLAAGAGEPAGRELTATQLVKVAYLADVAHAARHAGATFTLAPWRFAHLGPHAPELEARVPVVVRRSGALTRGAYYSLEDDERGLLRAAERALPAVVTGAITRALRAFVRDTNGLLAHVYATRPMRRAAPGELLDFSAAPAHALIAPAVAPAALAPLAPQRRAALAARIRARAAATASAPAQPHAEPAAPRLRDACYLAGQHALDAGARPVHACEGSLEAAPEVWTAPARTLS